MTGNITFSQLHNVFHILLIVEEKFDDYPYVRKTEPIIHTQRFPTDLATFTEEILNGKLHLYSAVCKLNVHKNVQRFMYAQLCFAPVG